ncbi:MAG: hypothetical protein H7311_06710 [Ramlibacter sp.]|nr:hypothetical protein [Cryobacterium sp.]
MSAIWVSVSAVAAIGAACLGVGCALASLPGPGRTVVAVPAMVLMAAATVDGPWGLRPLPWVALLVGAALLSLLDRNRRVAAAHHASALLLMAVMWVSMLPATTATVAAASGGAVTASGPAALSAAGRAVHSAAHGGHGLGLAGPGGLMLGVLVAAASVAPAVSAHRTARCAPGSRGSAVADRLEAAQHLSMALAMTMMAGGMLLPLIGA